MDPMVVMVALAALAAGVVLLGVVAGALLAGAALLLGIGAGVRVRAGLEPVDLLPNLRQFLERYVAGREAAGNGAAKEAAGGAGGKRGPGDPKPAAKL